MATISGGVHGGVEALGGLVRRPLDLGLAQPGFDRTDDAASDLILQFEDVLECPPSNREAQICAPVVVSITWPMIPLRTLPKLELHDVEPPRQPRDRSNDLLDDAVSKILLLRVATEILKRQYHQ